MAKYVKVNGTWRTVTADQAADCGSVKVGGTWRTVTNSYVKVNGVWRSTCEPIPPVTPPVAPPVSPPVSPPTPVSPPVSPPTPVVPPVVPPVTPPVTPAVTCGECYTTGVMIPTCNGEDVYEGYYTIWQKDCSDGTSTSVGCPSGQTFNGFGNLIQANSPSCGGSPVSPPVNPPTPVVPPVNPPTPVVPPVVPPEPVVPPVNPPTPVVPPVNPPVAPPCSPCCGFSYDCYNCFCDGCQVFC